MGYKIGPQKGEYWASAEIYQRELQRDRERHKSKSKEEIEAARKRASDYYYKNREKISEKAVAYRASRKQQQREYNKEYCQKNRAAILSKKKEYYQKNKARFSAYWQKIKSCPKRIARHNEISSKRRLIRRGASTNSTFETKFIYEFCKAITLGSGIEHHVDHIAPMHPYDRRFCGLHIWTNLRIVPATVNLSKLRHYDEEELISKAQLNQ